jgi:hypothetical protein
MVLWHALAALMVVALGLVAVQQLRSTGVLHARMLHRSRSAAGRPDPM